MLLRKSSSASFSFFSTSGSFVHHLIISRSGSVTTSLPWSSKPFIVISRRVSSLLPFYPIHPLVAIMSYYNDINVSKPKSSVLLNMTKHGRVFSINDNRTLQ